MADPVSGKDGTVHWDTSQLSQVTAWNLSEVCETKPYHTNESGGTRKRVAGVMDWTATVTVKDRPTCNPGDTATLELALDSGGYYSGPGILQARDPTVDIDGGEINSWDLRFEANGAMTFTSGSLS